MKKSCDSCGAPLGLDLLSSFAVIGADDLVAYRREQFKSRLRGYAEGILPARCASALVASLNVLQDDVFLYALATGETPLPGPLCINCLTPLEAEAVRCRASASGPCTVDLPVDAQPREAHEGFQLDPCDWIVESAEETLSIIGDEMRASATRRRARATELDTAQRELRSAQLAESDATAHAASMDATSKVMQILTTRNNVFSRVFLSLSAAKDHRSQVGSESRHQIGFLGGILGAVLSPQSSADPVPQHSVHGTSDRAGEAHLLGSPYALMLGSSYALIGGLRLGWLPALSNTSITSPLSGGSASAGNSKDRPLAGSPDRCLNEVPSWAEVTIALSMLASSLLQAGDCRSSSNPQPVRLSSSGGKRVMVPTHSICSAKPCAAVWESDGTTLQVSICHVLRSLLCSADRLGPATVHLFKTGIKLTPSVSLVGVVVASDDLAHVHAVVAVSSAPSFCVDSDVLFEVLKTILSSSLEDSEPLESNTLKSPHKSFRSSSVVLRLHSITLPVHAPAMHFHTPFGSRTSSATPSPSSHQETCRQKRSSRPPVFLSREATSLGSSLSRRCHSAVTHRCGTFPSRAQNMCRDAPPIQGINNSYLCNCAPCVLCAAEATLRPTLFCTTWSFLLRAALGLLSQAIHGESDQRTSSDHCGEHRADVSLSSPSEPSGEASPHPLAPQLVPLLNERARLIFLQIVSLSVVVGSYSLMMDDPEPPFQSTTAAAAFTSACAQATTMAFQLNN